MRMTVTRPGKSPSSVIILLMALGTPYAALRAHGMVLASATIFVTTVEIQERLDEAIGVVPGLSDMSADEQQALMRLLGRALDRLLRAPGEPDKGVGAG